MVRIHQRKKALSCLVASLCTSLAACGDPSAEADDDALGSATLSVSKTPPGIACLEAVVQNEVRSSTRFFDLVPGTEQQFSVAGLAFGDTTFTAYAHASACDEVTDVSTASFASLPVVTNIAPPPAVAEVFLKLLANGQAGVSLGFEEYAQECAVTNVALNASTAGSSRGWGGGSNPQELVDGATCYGEWAHGLAFTGGVQEWMGEACGWRQVTLDFGAQRQLTGPVVAYHHGAEHIPTDVKIEIFDGSAWQEVFVTSEGKSFLEPDTCPVGSTPARYDIGPQTASQLRLWINNCNTTHSWLYEVTAEGCE